MRTWHERAKVATKGIKFECQRCAKCCSGEVVLTYWDVERILKEHTDLKAAIVPTISPRYSNLGSIFSILHVHQPRQNGPGWCFYFRDNACMIYEARPLACQIYPFSIELKKSIKKKGKFPKRTPVFRDSNTSLAYVVVYDPNCPGIGKGKEVGFEEIFSLESQNIIQILQTYKTNLKDKIWSLIANEQELKVAEEYCMGMKIIQESGKNVKWKGKDVPLQIIIGYNPRDIAEDKAKQLVELAYDDWSSTFPTFQGCFLIYNFSEKKEVPPKMMLLYLGCEPLKENLTIEEFYNCWGILLASEELREKAEITLGVRKVRLENGKWIIQLR